MDGIVPRFGENSEELLEVELGRGFLPYAQISHLEELGQELLGRTSFKISPLGYPWKSNYNLVDVNGICSSWSPGSVRTTCLEASLSWLHCLFSCGPVLVKRTVLCFSLKDAGAQNTQAAFLEYHPLKVKHGLFIERILV